MDVIKIACPCCESRMAEFAFGAAEGVGFVSWNSSAVQNSNDDCVSAIGDDYFIRCSKAICNWSKRISKPDLIKITFQACKEQIYPLILTSEHLKSLLKEYEANPDRWIEWSIEFERHESSQVEKIGTNTLPPESNRWGRRKAQAKDRQALVSEH